MGTAIQRKAAFDPATCMGAGRLEELREQLEPLGAELVIFDHELTGIQVRNIEDILEVRVIDRTTLILDIFAQRARTKEGKLQVELAQQKYRLPRLTGMGTALSRLGGGIGTRGPGETKLETDKRHIRRRIAALEEDVLRGDGDADVLASARGRPGDALHESQVEDVDGAAAVEVLCGGGASGVEGVLEGGDVPIAVLVGGRRGSRAEERRHAERREERSLVSHLHISPFYAGRPAFYWYHYSIYGGGCQGWVPPLQFLALPPHGGKSSIRFSHNKGTPSLAGRPLFEKQSTGLFFKFTPCGAPSIRSSAACGRRPEGSALWTPANFFCEKKV